MTTELVISISKQALYTAFILAAPILITALVVGVIISIFQAATSISDSTLNFAPKVIISGIVLLIIGPWMLRRIVEFMIYLVENIPEFIR